MRSRWRSRWRLDTLGLPHLPTIYEYIEVAPTGRTIDWQRLQSLDLDDDSLISSAERSRRGAWRWQPLFRVAEAEDGRIGLDELREPL